jgi:hypothetical protein
MSENFAPFRWAALTADYSIRNRSGQRALLPVMARSTKRFEGNLYKTRNMPFYIEIAASDALRVLLAMTSRVYVPRYLSTPIRNFQLAPANYSIRNFSTSTSTCARQPLNPKLFNFQLSTYTER